MENRILPPIDISSRTTKLNALNNVPSSSVAANKLINNENTSNVYATQIHELHTNGSIGSNEINLRSTKQANEINAKVRTGEKGDNSSTTIINYNLDAKANRVTGQPKLPTLESKTVVSSNCK